MTNLAFNELKRTLNPVVTHLLEFELQPTNLVLTCSKAKRSKYVNNKTPEEL